MFCHRIYLPTSNQLPKLMTLTLTEDHRNWWLTLLQACGSRYSIWWPFGYGSNFLNPQNKIRWLRILSSSSQFCCSKVLPHFEPHTHNPPKELTALPLKKIEPTKKLLGIISSLPCAKAQNFSGASCSRSGVPNSFLSTILNHTHAGASSAPWRLEILSARWMVSRFVLRCFGWVST